jgi:hypothetical protein
MSENYTRDDNVPGYVYIMEAEGFHGLMSGLCKRIKIGLSRNPEAREDTLNSNQPPCDITLIDKAYVWKMKDAETYLHNKFKSRNVQLKKSREWFDFDYVSYHILLREFKNLKNNPRWCPNAKRFFFSINLNFGSVLLLIALLFVSSYFLSSRNSPEAVRTEVKR